MKRFAVVVAIVHPRTKLMDDVHLYHLDEPECVGAATCRATCSRWATCNSIFGFSSVRCRIEATFHMLSNSADAEGMRVQILRVEVLRFRQDGKVELRILEVLRDAPGPRALYLVKS